MPGFRGCSPDRESLASRSNAALSQGRALPACDASSGAQSLDLAALVPTCVVAARRRTAVMDPSRTAGQLCTSLKQAPFERALSPPGPGPVYHPHGDAVGKQPLSTKITAPSYVFGTSQREEHIKNGEHPGGWGALTRLGRVEARGNVNVETALGLAHFSSRPALCRLPGCQLSSSRHALFADTPGPGSTADGQMYGKIRHSSKFRSSATPSFGTSPRDVPTRPDGPGEPRRFRRPW